MLTDNLQPRHWPTPRRYIQITLLAWLAILGIDFLFHGGIFAAVYYQGSPFLLSAQESFRRIPWGYLALLVTAGLLVWVIVQTKATTWRQGLLTGLAFGVAFGGAFLVGLYSISTVSLPFLTAWFTSLVCEMAIGGSMIAHNLNAPSLRRITLATVIGFILLLAATILMQNIGLAPAIIL